MSRISTAPEAMDGRGSTFFLPFMMSGKGLPVFGITLIFILFFLPILKLFVISIASEAGISLSHYIDILRERRTWRVLENTFWLVTGSTILSVFIGVVVAWFVGYCDVRHRKWMHLLILLPLILPSYIITLAWTQWMGPMGVNLYSMGGMIFVMGISHYPLVYLLTLGVLRKIPRELEFAARASGASSWSVFAKITLPLALPGVAGGGLLAFLASLDNFGIPAFLGIPANISVLSTYIYEQITGFGPSAFARAAVLSVILGAMALLGTFFHWLMIRKSGPAETVHEDREPRVALGKLRGLLEGILWLFLMGTSCIPLMAMVLHSFVKAYGLELRPENFTLDHYRFLLFESEKAKQAMMNSFLLASITTLVCLVAGTAIAYFRTRRPSLFTRIVEAAVGLPYALPGVVWALAITLTWMEPVPGWNPGIYGSMAILYIAYVTRFMILQVRGSVTALMQVEPSQEEAARACGANGRTRWFNILLPLLSPGLFSGAFFVWLASLTELTVSSLLGSTGNETIGMVIFNFEQAGYTTYSTSFSSLIVLLILIGMTVLHVVKRFQERKVKPE